MNQVEYLIFFFLTLLLIWLTWFISLRGKRYHGIFRFFAFESIVLLVIRNHSYWFRDPASWNQILSWAFLLGSLLIALSAFITFYKKGKPSDGMEQTTHLIQSGLYAFVRHPLYLSLILGGLGIMWKHPGSLEIILTIINTFALYLTAKVEEKEMLASFGKKYEIYMMNTKMFIPYII